MQPPSRRRRPSILIAGIGNIFLGDDGFGVEVVRRLRDERLGDEVEVADFGIRGVHLAYELADGRYDAAIFVDAVSRGGPPGTLYAFEPGLDASSDAVVADAHTLSPDAVLAWVRRVGAAPVRIVVVGCEAGTVEESMDLSAPVAASVDRAVEMVRDLVAQMSGAMPCA